METFKPIKEGKVREIYDIGDYLVMTHDRDGQDQLFRRDLTQ